jgi:hypothetical protein
MKQLARWLVLAGWLIATTQGIAQVEDITRPRIWTSASGAEMKAKFVELSGDQVILKNRRGKPIQIPRAKLSPSDQALLDAVYGPATTPSAFEDEFGRPDPGSAGPESLPAVDVQDTPSAQEPIRIGGTKIPLEQKTTFHIPLDAESIKALKKADNDATEAVIGLWLPVDFDPSTEWNILLISAMADTSISHMDGYLDSAKEAGGWIVIAADGPLYSPSGDTAQRHWRMVRAGLLALDAAWPGARQWPIATGGFFDGAERSGLLSALLCKNGWSLIGMYMGGCKKDMASRGQKKYHPKRSIFRKIPVYLSVGKKDNIISLMDVNEVRLSMKSNGFKDVRMETYNGGHKPDQSQITESLQWFKEVEAKKAVRPTNTRRPSRLSLPAPSR